MLAFKLLTAQLRGSVGFRNDPEETIRTEGARSEVTAGRTRRPNVGEARIARAGASEPASPWVRARTASRGVPGASEWARRVLAAPTQTTRGSEPARRAWEGAVPVGK